MNSSLHLRSVRLRVPDLTRSMAFYVGQLGFAPVHKTVGRADLAVASGSPTLLTLMEDRAARPAPPDAAGLFHAALLLPGRAALGAWLQHAAKAGVEFEGFSDHGVSQAVYFADPDGNGLEFYVDRPRAEWPFAHGKLAMRTDPLDVPKLLAEAAPAGPFPLAGARWGHLHLRVTSLERSEAFYRTTLGLDLMQDSYPGARFLAADGYHHHLGLNIWGRPRQSQPAGALGLAETVFAQRSITSEQRLTDPDGITLRLVGL